MTAIYERPISELSRMTNMPGYFPMMGGPGYGKISPHMLPHLVEVQCMRQDYNFRFRDTDNASPHSVGSSSSSSSFQSPSPRAVDSPSPPTTASANKLYNLLKNPTTTSYSVEETWGQQPLDLKRKNEEQEAPVDLSVRKRPRVETYTPTSHRAFGYPGFSQDCYMVPSPERHQEQPHYHDRSTTNLYPNNQDCCSCSCKSASGRQMSPDSRSPMSPTGLIHSVYRHPENQYPCQRPHQYSVPTSNHVDHVRQQVCTPTQQNIAQTSRPSSASQGNNKGSLLHSILSGGFQQGYHTDQDTTSTKYNTKSTVVCLAKKNLLPVTARVSDWVVKIIEFSQAMPEFNCLTEHDKIKLIDNSWTRILLLCMAETAFEFAVTPVGENVATSGREASSDATPTMKDVEHIQQFIKKCQALNLDPKEVDILKKIVLFSPDSSVVNMPVEIEGINARARQNLLTYVKEVQPGHMMRYSHLLLILPPLYGINANVIEKLFCKNISADSHMDILLKEMIARR